MLGEGEQDIVSMNIFHFATLSNFDMDFPTCLFSPLQRVGPGTTVESSLLKVVSTKVLL